METLKKTLEKLPEYEKKAKESEELMLKIAKLTAQNNIILRKLAEKEGIKLE